MASDWTKYPATGEGECAKCRKAGRLYRCAEGDWCVMCLAKHAPKAAAGAGGQHGE